MVRRLPVHLLPPPKKVVPLLPKVLAYVFGPVVVLLLLGPRHPKLKNHNVAGKASVLRQLFRRRQVSFLPVVQLPLVMLQLPLRHNPVRHLPNNLPKTLLLRLVWVVVTGRLPVPFQPVPRPLPLPRGSLRPQRLQRRLLPLPKPGRLVLPPDVVVVPAPLLLPRLVQLYAVPQLAVRRVKKAA